MPMEDDRCQIHWETSLILFPLKGHEKGEVKYQASSRQE